jgi:hypothetical protein
LAIISFGKDHIYRGAREVLLSTIPKALEQLPYPFVRFFAVDENGMSKLVLVGDPSKMNWAWMNRSEDIIHDFQYGGRNNGLLEDENFRQHAPIIGPGLAAKPPVGNLE